MTGQPEALKAPFEYLLPSQAWLSYAELSQDGFDLVLSLNGEILRVPDYFSFQTPPSLVLDSGPSLTPTMVKSLLPRSFTSDYLYAGPAAGAGLGEPIGKVSLLAGTATVRRTDGSTEPLQKGDPVYKGDVLITGDGSFVKIRFNDGTTFQLGKNGEAALDSFEFNESANIGRFEASVRVGGFYYKSGKIGEVTKAAGEAHTKLSTPSSIISVRGSELEGSVDSSGKTSVIHRSGVLVVTDQNGNNGVTLDQPGSAAVVARGDAPAFYSQASADVIQEVQESVQPQTSDDEEVVQEEAVEEVAEEEATEEDTAEEEATEEESEEEVEETGEEESEEEESEEEESEEEESEEEAEEESDEEAEEESEEEAEEESEESAEEEAAEEDSGEEEAAEEESAEEETAEEESGEEEAAEEESAAEETAEEESAEEEESAQEETVEEESAEEEAAEEESAQEETVEEESAEEEAAEEESAAEETAEETAEEAVEEAAEESSEEAAEEAIEEAAEESSEESASEESTGEDAGAEESASEESASGEEGAAEDTGAEESVSEESASGEEGAAEDTGAEESVSEESASGEEANTEESAGEETSPSEEAASEDFAGESASSEESATEETSTESAASEEASSDVEASGDAAEDQVGSDDASSEDTGSDDGVTPEGAPEAAGETSASENASGSEAGSDEVASADPAANDDSGSASQETSSEEAPTSDDSALEVGSSDTTETTSTSEAGSSEGASEGSGGESSSDGGAESSSAPEATASETTASEASGSESVASDAPESTTPESSGAETAQGGTESSSVDAGTGSADSANSTENVTSAQTTSESSSSEATQSQTASDAGSSDSSAATSTSDTSSSTSDASQSTSTADASSAQSATEIASATDSLPSLQTQSSTVDTGSSSSSETTQTETAQPEVIPDNPPVAEPDVIEVTSTTTVNLSEVLLANDFDADAGQSPQLQSVNIGSAAGTIESGTQFSFTPDANLLAQLDEGETFSDQFTYTITSGGLTATGEVTVNYVGVNDAPSAQNDSIEVPEVTNVISVDVLANDIDVDGDVLQITGIQVLSGTGVVEISEDGKSLSYTAAENLSSGESVTVVEYTITDGDVSATATVTITTSNANDDPSLTDDAYSVDEGSVSRLDVLSNDADADIDDELLIVEFDDSGLLGTVSISSDGLSLDYAAPQVSGADSLVETFDYAVTDGDVIRTATVSITVNNVNSAPFIEDDLISVSESETVDLDVLGNDSDPNPGDVINIIAINSEGLIGQVLINPDGKSIRYVAPEVKDVSEISESFTYTASDGEVSSTATVTITVLNANDAPVAEDDVFEALEQESITLNVLANDSDPDGEGTLTLVSIDSETTLGQAVISEDGQSIIYSSASLQDGVSISDGLSYTVSDGQATATATVSIKVLNQNDGPLVQDEATQITEDETVDFAVLANDSDPDLDALLIESIDATGLRGTATISSDGQRILYSPPQDLSDGEVVENVIYTVSDGELTSEGTLSITVAGINDPPQIVASTDAFTLDLSSSEAQGVEEFEIPLSAIISDADADAEFTVLEVDTSGLKGSIRIGSILYSPGDALDYLGEGETDQESFGIRVQDDSGATATGTFTFTVSGVNDPPQFDSASYAGEVVEDSVLTASGQLVATDPDQNAVLVYSTADTSAYGAFVLDPDSGQWLYTLDEELPEVQSLREGDQLTEMFNVSVTDDKGATDQSVITLTITGTNDGLTVTTGASDLEASEDGAAVTGNFVVMDIDASDIVTYSVSGLAAAGEGSVTIDADTGEYSYAPGSDFQSLAVGETTQVTFDVTATSDDGVSVETQTVTVAINGTREGALVGSNDLFAQIPEANGSESVSRFFAGYGRPLSPDALALSGQATNTANGLIYFNSAEAIAPLGIEGNGTEVWYAIQDATATQLINPAQLVQVDPSSLVVAGETVSLVLQYATSDGNSSLTGMGLRVHYNSSLISDLQLSNLLQDGLLLSSDEADSADFDNDPSTDRYLLVTWADIDLDWPGVSSVDLLALSFTLDASLPVNTSTGLRLTGISSEGYTFSGGSIDVFAIYPADQVNGWEVVAGHWVLETTDEILSALGGAEIVTEVFDFSIGADSFAFTVDLVGQNNAPVYQGIYESQVADSEGHYQFSSTDLRVLDVDNDPVEITFSISQIEGGEIQVDGVTVNRFTYADVISGTVAFVPNPIASSNRFFSFTVDDLDEDGSEPNEYIFVIKEAAGTLTFTEDDPVSAVNSETITITVSSLLENDVTSASKLLSVDSVNPTTSLGGSVYFDGINFVYTAPKTAVGEDRIEYTIVDETGARVDAYLVVQLTAAPAEKASSLGVSGIEMIEAGNLSLDRLTAKSTLTTDFFATGRLISSSSENGPMLLQTIPGLFTLLLANQQLAAGLSASFGTTLDPLTGQQSYLLTSSESNAHSNGEVRPPADLTNSMEGRVITISHVPVLTEVVETQVRLSELGEIRAATGLPGQESIVSPESFDRIANASASVESSAGRTEVPAPQILNADFERVEPSIALEVMVPPVSAEEDVEAWLIGSASELEKLITTDGFQLQSDDFLIDFERVQGSRDDDPAFLVRNEAYPDLGLQDVFGAESDTLEFLVDSEIRQVLEHQRPNALAPGDALVLSDYLPGDFDDLWQPSSVPEIEVILHQNSVDLFT